MSDKTNLGCGCFAALATLMAAACLVAVAFAFILGGICSQCADTDGGAKEERVPERELVLGSDEADASPILRVKIDGEISFDSRQGFLNGLETASSAKTALRHIRAAERDEDIEGLLIELNTPGGGVTESDEIWHAVRRFRESQTNRFVVVHMGAMCCSGGYYIASAADFVMARPTTLTGSIGVIMSTVNAAELAKKVGVESVNITSGGNKALLDPLQPVSPEHVEIMKRAIMADYERFVGIVAQGRSLPKDRVRQLADGRIFSAADALKEKLVDAIGYREDVLLELENLADNDIGVYQYKTELTFDLASLGGLCSDCISRLADAIVMRALARPSIQHLYR